MDEPVKTIELIVWSPLTALILRIWAVVLLAVGLPVVLRIWHASFKEMRSALKQLHR